MGKESGGLDIEVGAVLDVSSFERLLGTAVDEGIVVGGNVIATSDACGVEGGLESCSCDVVVPRTPVLPSAEGAMLGGCGTVALSCGGTEGTAGTDGRVTSGTGGTVGTVGTDGIVRVGKGGTGGTVGTAGNAG